MTTPLPPHFAEKRRNGEDMSLYDVTVIGDGCEYRLYNLTQEELEKEMQGGHVRVIEKKYVDAYYFMPTGRNDELEAARRAALIWAADQCKAKLERLRKTPPNPYDESWEHWIDGKIDGLEDVESTLREAAENL